MSWTLILVFIFTILYLVNKYLFSHWTRQNIEQVEPKFLVGSFGKLLTLKAPICDAFTEFYEKYKHKRFIGAYFSYKPILIINDPELIQNVMIKDFSAFHDRSSTDGAAERYPLIGNLFNLKGQKWRELRVKLTPTFTSGKVKLMFPILRDCGKVLQKYVEESIKNGNTALDFKDLFARLMMNNISSIAFGVENDSINDPDNAFRATGLKMFETTFLNGIRFFLSFCMPEIIVKLKIDPIAPEITKFIYSLVNQTIDYRKKNNFRRNDFMQLLIDLKDKGYVPVDKDFKDEIEWKEGQKHEANLKKITIDDIAAQVFLFLGAGYETSSTTMSFCIFEISKNREIQKKVQDEIDLVMKKAGPEGITYELINEMKYLECCIDETLRKYPVAPILFREASQDYTIPDTDVVIKKGTSIFMPVMGIQRDPEIYDDPLAFKPERFLDSHNGNPKVASGIVYMPFGHGPRNCIAARLGKLQAKLGLMMILQKFNCELQDKSLLHRELRFHPKSFSTSPLENIAINVTLRTP